MITFLRRRWFPCALLVLIAGGMLLGGGMSDGQTQAEAAFGRLGPSAETFVALLPRLATAAVLFLMAFTLDNSHLRDAFRSPGPVLWATGVNLGIVPLFGWALMPLQTIPDFSIGLMIAAAVPTTVAAASVWTRRAGGNDAVSLLATLVTNGACFAVTPFWLNLTTGRSIRLDPWSLMAGLMVAVLIPSVVGQALRQVSGAARFARRYRTEIGVVAQGCILVIVFLAAWKAGAQLRADGPQPKLAGVLLVWVSAIAIHLAAMWVGLRGASLCRFAWPDRVAVMFAASQKTLPIGVLLATDPTMFGHPDLLGPGRGVPLVVFPMLMFHASQLFIDTAVADRLTGRRSSALGEPGNDEASAEEA